MNYYTPTELANKYPKTGLSPMNIGTLAKCGLFISYEKYRQFFIEEKSFIDLINYRNNLNLSKLDK